MSQLKKFNVSESEQYNSSNAYEEGTLTWDTSNGLRIHDGYTNGGHQVGNTNYQDLTNLPNNLASIQSGNTGNNKQFLRYNSSTYEMEFSNDFRVVPVEGVDFPSGVIDVDKIGDIAFGQGTIYYCYQEPNSYTISYAGSNNWTPAGWLRINSVGPNNKIPQVGDKLTDGSNTSTIVSIEAPWQDQGYGQTFMLINISPAVSSWKNGTGDLTLYTGSAPHLICWAKLADQIVSAPAHNDSPGVIGQTAFDEDYIYRCTQTNVAEVSYVYDLPIGRNTSPYNWPNQADPTALRLFQRGDAVAPQVGWKTYDGTNLRTITNVSTQNSGFGVIHELTLDSGVDYSTATTITVYQTQPVEAVWKRTPLNADTW